MEEITTAAADSSQRADETGKLVATTRDDAEKSGEVVSSAIAAMRLQGFFVEANRRSKLPAPWTPKTAASALNATIIGLIEEWALERSELQLAP